MCVSEEFSCRLHKYVKNTRDFTMSRKHVKIWPFHFHDDLLESALTEKTECEGVWRDRVLWE